MHLTKALAALSAGSLLLIGHSTLVYAQDDPYADEEATSQEADQASDSSSTDEWSTDSDMQASETEGEDTSDDMTAQSDDSWSTDEETTADVDVDAETDVESQSTMDTYAQTESEDPTASAEGDDEFSADVDVDSSVATTDDPMATEDDEFSASADVDADVDSESSVASSGMSSDTELEPQVAQIDVEVDVDEQKIQELAQIHVEMQEETKDLADQMSGAGSTEDAQELQAQMVDRQVEVIERHGWTRDEYNAVVDTVNENPDLRAQFIENVVNSDTAVAQTESEDPAAPEDETDY